jgi:hypothetical protein
VCFAAVPCGPQIERKVREVVEDTLLDQGIAAYRYVEGLEGGQAGGGGAAGSDAAAGTAADASVAM